MQGLLEQLIMGVSIKLSVEKIKGGISPPFCFDV